MSDTNGNTRASDVIRLLEDDCARQILIEIQNEPMSANALSERCDVSPPTIYRRLEDLNEHGLIDEDTRVASDGHHYSVYVATLDHVEIDLTDDGLEVEVTKRERMADRFTSFVEEMR